MGEGIGMRVRASRKEYDSVQNFQSGLAGRFTTRTG